MNKKKAVIIFGPTASGKTSLGINIAQQLNGVIINADSRQIYQEMPIITAMPSKEEFNSVPHLLFSFLKPNKEFSVDKYIDMAKNACNDVFSQNKLPIFVGGTGFYLKVLTEGLSPIPDIPQQLVNELTKKAKDDSIEILYKELTMTDPIIASKLKPTDSHRIIRALSVFKHTNTTLSSWQKVPAVLPMPDVDFIKIAINPPREILYKRIHDRFDIMLKNGVIKEAEILYNKNYSFNNQALGSLGLKEFFAYINGELTIEQAEQKTAQQMRRYAKRQTTWLNNQYNPNITLLNNKLNNDILSDILMLLK